MRFVFKPDSVGLWLYHRRLCKRQRDFGM